jgi:hypothetical protein
MKTRSSIALGIALCLLLTACGTTSVNPLSSPDSAQPDPKLFGAWHPRDDASEIYTIFPKDAHWMHIVDKKKDQPPQEYDAFVTVLGKLRILNVLNVEKDAKGNVKKSYILNIYEASANKFTIYWIDQEKAADLIRAGKLKGTIKENKSSAGPQADMTVQITDTTANIVALLNAQGPDALYDSKPSDFFRLGPPKQH